MGLLMIAAGAIGAGLIAESVGSVVGAVSDGVANIVQTFTPKETLDSQLSDLEKLKSLYDKGVINKKEFEKKKKQILGL